MTVEKVDRHDVFVPTDKGSDELKGGATQLPASRIELLVMLDGKATLAEIIARFPDRKPDDILRDAQILADAGQIEMARPGLDVEIDFSYFFGPTTTQPIGAMVRRAEAEADGGTQRLTRLLGAGKALPLMLSGRTVESEEALSLGLVTQVLGEAEEREVKGKVRRVPSLDRDAFLAQVIELARGYCTPNRAALAAGHIKRAVQSGGELPLESGLALERELQAKLFASDDAREGLSAFVEKRKPAFTNR